MIKIIKKIGQIRKKNLGKLLIFHFSVISIIFILSYLPQIEFVAIPRLISTLYFLFCIYFIINVLSKRANVEKGYFVVWAIFVHSIFFITVEIEENKLNYFIIIMVLNLLLSIFAIHKKEITLDDT